MQLLGVHKVLFIFMVIWDFVSVLYLKISASQQLTKNVILIADQTIESVYLLAKEGFEGLFFGKDF